MLSARSSSSESTTDSTSPDRSIISSGSIVELCMDVIVSEPLYAELVSLECEPLLHFWYKFTNCVAGGEVFQIRL